MVGGRIVLVWGDFDVWSLVADTVIMKGVADLAINVNVVWVSVWLGMGMATLDLGVTVGGV